MGHQVDEAHRFGLAQITEVVEGARCEKVGEVLRQSQESVQLFGVLRVQIRGPKALDLGLELSVAEL